MACSCSLNACMLTISHCFCKLCDLYRKISECWAATREKRNMSLSELSTKHLFPLNFEMCSKILCSLSPDCSLGLTKISSPANFGANTWYASDSSECTSCCMKRVPGVKLSLSKLEPLESAVSSGSSLSSLSNSS